MIAEQGVGRVKTRPAWRSTVGIATLWVPACLVLGLVLVGCHPATVEPIYTIVSDGVLTPGQPVPVPQSTPILTITGQIGTLNGQDRLEFDLALIESMRVVEYTVIDPFEQRERLYRGVLVSDLFALAGLHSSATTLELVALNDYHITLPLSLLLDYPVILAFQCDGEYMKPNFRGPLMVVFPYGYYPFERPETDLYWVWQLRSIHVR